MAVIAAGMITLSFERDILANYRYYKLQSSTATPPTKPTSIATLPPSGWTDTEPTYTEGSTNTLYMVDLTTYSDGTFYYTPVLKSSSYEAAKSAYNKAVAAQNTASAAQESIDNLEIGGRNLILDSGTQKTTTGYANRDFLLSEEGKKLQEGDNVTFTIKARIATDRKRWAAYNSGGSTTISGLQTINPDGESDVIYTWHGAWHYLENQSFVRFYLGTSSTTSTSNIIYWAKLERGNKPSDWTPAPEDTEKAITDAKILYAESSTDAATAEKVATITPAVDDFDLRVGTILHVKFSATNSAAVANLKLNVNSTGAKPIKYFSNTSNQDLPGVGYLAKDILYTFTYDGTNWVVAIDRNTNDNYYDRIRFQVAITAGVAIVAKNIIVADANGKYSHLKRGAAFDVTYPILYANAAISANATGTNNYLAFYFAIATTQALTLTVNKAVYIKGTLNNNLFTPVSTKPLTQTVPTSVDGYQYIRLGFAYSATNIYMDTDHAIYEYNNGGFKTTSQIADEARERVQAMFNNLNGVDQFNALTQNGALNGIFYSDNGNAYINAAFIKTGSLAADKIAVTDLQAFGATIGGFDVDTTSIHTHNVAVTSNAEKSVALSSDLFTRTLGGVERANLKLAIGANFGVGKDGTLYATNGVFTGKISGSTIIFTSTYDNVDYSVTASAKHWENALGYRTNDGVQFFGNGIFGISATGVDILSEAGGVYITSLSSGSTKIRLATSNGRQENYFDITDSAVTTNLEFPLNLLNVNGGYLGYVGGADSSKSLDNYWTQGQYSVSGSTGRPAKSSAWGILLSFMGNANEDIYSDDYGHSWGLQLYSDNYQLYYRTKTKSGTGAWKNVSTVTKDFTVTLSSLTWAASGSGMYYSSNIMSSAEQSYWDSIDSVSLTGNWSNLRKTDIIIPYAGANNVALMSNVNSFASSSAKVTVRVTGRRGNATS